MTSRSPASWKRVMNGDLPWEKGAKPVAEPGENTKEVRRR